MKRVIHFILCAGVTSALAAAEAAAQVSRVPSGLSVGFDVFVTRPLPNGVAREPFDSIGRFRAGPGTSLVIGYGGSALGVALRAEMAGLEIGEPFERGGIPMGRRSALQQAYGLTVDWRPPLGPWGVRPEILAGVFQSHLGEVSVPLRQLPAYARDSAAGSDSALVGLGLRGTAIRIGVAAERTITLLEGEASLRAEITLDQVAFGTLRVGERTVGLPRRARADIPRIAIGLRWRPLARQRDDVPADPTLPAGGSQSARAIAMRPDPPGAHPPTSRESAPRSP